MTAFGLGNPGEQYRYTRHNVGFLTVDRIATRLGIRFHHLPGKFVARTEIQKQHLILVKPLLFMNYSGIVVKEHLIQEPDDFLVVLDDLALPFGTLRLRAKGSAGGHKGLASIIYHLGTEEFPRLRIGIGFPESTTATDYVLGRWTPMEETQLPNILDLAADACLTVITEGFTAAMNRYNSSVATAGHQLTPNRQRTVRQ